MRHTAGADPDEAVASLANIEQLEAHWLLPGHGSPSTGDFAAAVAAARDVGIEAFGPTDAVMP